MTFEPAGNGMIRSTIATVVLSIASWAFSGHTEGIEANIEKPQNIFSRQH